MMTFVYMIECNDGTFYTGYTTDLKARIESITQVVEQSIQEEELP